MLRFTQHDNIKRLRMTKSQTVSDRTIYQISRGVTATVTDSDSISYLPGFVQGSAK